MPLRDLPECEIIRFGKRVVYNFPPSLERHIGPLGNAMTENNILPYDGQAILIDDHGAAFDWPAITRTLIGTIPWQVETARIFGREMPIPRMTAWRRN